MYKGARLCLASLNLTLSSVFPVELGAHHDYLVAQTATEPALLQRERLCVFPCVLPPCVRSACV